MSIKSSSPKLWTSRFRAAPEIACFEELVFERERELSLLSAPARMYDDALDELDSEESESREDEEKWSESESFEYLFRKASLRARLFTF